MDGFLAELKKIPPVTRFLCGSSLAVTLSSILGFLSPYSAMFVQELVTKKLQIWRLYTCFFLSSGGIGYIFELLMLYRTVNELETKAYHLRSADLAWQTVLAAGTIIAATLPLRAHILTRPLLVCLVYLNSTLAPPGTMTSIMGLVTVPVAYFPYVLIAFDFLVIGPAAAAQSVAGAAVGHLWWWSVWGGRLGSEGRYARLARAPRWMLNLLGERGGSGPPPAAGGTAAGLARSGIHVTAPAGRRTATGPGVTGHSWGSGQRLGEE